MKIGYARVSTSKQDLTRQTDWLMSMECEKIFSEKVSGTAASVKRPKMAELLSVIRPGDTLFIDEISRLGRNISETITTITTLLDDDIEIVLNKEGMTLSKSNPIGTAIASIFAVIANIELIYKKERSSRAAAIAKERGRAVGRKPGLSEKAKLKVQAAKKIYNDKDSTLTIDEMAESLGISKTTFYSYLKTAGVVLYRDK